MNKDKIIINLFVFNSYKNLNQIARNLFKSNLNIKKIIVIDNNSSNTLQEKKNYLNEIKKNYKFKIKLVVNKKNYGLGGSHKILFNILEKEKFDYFINLGTTNRYFISKVLSDVKKNIKFKKDYYIFSRFLEKKNTKNYSFTRKIANVFFIKLTRILTQTYFTDPGSSTVIMKNIFFKKIKKLNYSQITNGSHFTHFFNILVYKNNSNVQEIPIIWREGNVKSHLKSGSYVVILFFSLIKFRLTNKFFNEKKNNFKFSEFNF